MVPAAFIFSFLCNCFALLKAISLHGVCHTVNFLERVQMENPYLKMGSNLGVCCTEAVHELAYLSWLESS